MDRRTTLTSGLLCVALAMLPACGSPPAQAPAPAPATPAATASLTDPLGGAVLGIGLNAFADRLNTIINNAGTQGRLIAIEAGQQLWLTIYNAQQAYASEREKTFRQLNQTIQGNIQTLANALQQLEREGFERSEDIIRQAQQVTNSLPFANKTPQVRGFSPSFVIHGADPRSAVESGGGSAESFLGLARDPAILAATPRDSRAEFLDAAALADEPVRVEINGNFPDAAKADYRPDLARGEETWQPQALTTQQLVFLIPRAALAISPGATLGYTPFKLRVPFKPGLFSRRQIATFGVLIASLPAAGGTITFTGTTMSTEREHRQRGTPMIAQHSNDDDLDLVHCGTEPLDGWIVEPDSTRFHHHWSQGRHPDDWRYYHQSSNPRVCYRVITIKRTWGTSGKVNFSLVWREFRDRTVPRDQTQTFTMQWGQSRVFQYPPGQWRATVTTFDGVTQEFSDAVSVRNRFLRVAATPTHVTLHLPRADEIRW